MLLFHPFRRGRGDQSMGEKLGRKQCPFHTRIQSDLQNNALPIKV